MELGQRLAVLSDIHGEHRVLREVLARCQTDRVESIVLLGDLFDRLDQAEMCLRYLEEWPVTGVIGNHEREALDAFTESDHAGALHARQLLSGLGHRLVLDDVLFIHDEFGWKGVPNAMNGTSSAHARITFAGHTHYRSARDENGPLDLSTGRIRLRQERRYLINPGAVVEGQFAIWDRHESEVVFQRV